MSGPDGHRHAIFHELADFLAPGTLLVVNTSATLPASLPASGRMGPFTLNLSTRYGDRLWLAEPRRDHARPGPLPLAAGETIEVAGMAARLVAPYPRLPRLWFVAFDGQRRAGDGGRGRADPLRLCRAALPPALGVSDDLRGASRQRRDAVRRAPVLAARARRAWPGETSPWHRSNCTPASPAWRSATSRAT